MATDAKHEQPSADVDPDASPFDLQSIEGLPLTKAEKTELERVIQRYDRERAATGTS
ncbi:MAG: hypothetical protein H0V45_04305 [Actinobacteria bacterium]|nr:hypothetical protein [Actinomycetota bacterium]